MHERILFLIDIVQDSPEQENRFKILKRLLKRFIHQKLQFNPKHTFGLVTFTDKSQWNTKLTNHSSLLFKAIDGLNLQEPSTTDGWELKTALDLM